MVVYEMRIFSVGTLLGATTWITRFVNFWQEIETCWLGLSTVKRYFHMQEFNPYGAMGVSLTKQKLMYIILTPSIIGLYKFLWTYGSSVHIYM